MDQSMDQQADHSETQAHQERALKKRAPLTNVACADCRKRKIKVRLDMLLLMRVQFLIKFRSV